MKREFLFKGKRIDNGEWVEGDFIHGVGWKKGKSFILPIVLNLAYLGGGCDPLDGFEVIPETVGQFTGLLDKNDTKIFEDDLLGYTDVYSKVFLPVSFYNGKFMKQETRPDSHKWLTTNDHYFDLSFAYGRNEVIGNIHDNIK